VVASTDVWGSVARAVTGGHLTVRSILTGADVDPHSYAVSPADAAAIADAPLVVYNAAVTTMGRPGAGRPSGGQKRQCLLAARHANGDAANEHVFYDLNVAKAGPRRSPTGWRASTRPTPRTTGPTPPNSAAVPTPSPSPNTPSPPDIGRRSHHDRAVAYYLLAASGLVNRTPAHFTAANENETDPAPSDMAAVLDLINHRQVSRYWSTRRRPPPQLTGYRTPHVGRVCR